MRLMNGLWKKQVDSSHSKNILFSFKPFFDLCILTTSLFKIELLNIFLVLVDALTH